MQPTLQSHTNNQIKTLSPQLPELNFGQSPSMGSTGNLPEDALLEIWLRLPVKSLVRFRCISRYRFAFLKSSDFIDMHLKFSLARDDEKVLITRDVIQPFDDKDEYRNQLSVHSNDESLSTLIPNLALHGYSGESIFLAGSCHGIIFFISHRDDYIIFNPAIREFRILPPFTTGMVKTDFWYTRIGMGFCFDPVSNDYKVLNIVTYTNRYLEHSNFTKAEIYNLSTDTRRELDVLPYYLWHEEVGNGSLGLFFNGKIHWSAYNNELGEHIILSMDINTEVFHNFRFPVGVKNDGGGNLLLVNDSLALTSCWGEMIDIWIMKEYGVEKSWSKQYSIGPFSSPVLPLPVLKNGQLFLERLVKEEEYVSELLAWDAQKNEQVRKFDIYGLMRSIGVVFYKETLLSITK